MLITDMVLSCHSDYDSRCGRDRPSLDLDPAPVVSWPSVYLRGFDIAQQ